MKFSNIFTAIGYFWHAKKIWRKPGEAKVLIYDRSGSDVFLKYIAPDSVEILDLHGESLNLYVLFKSFIHRRFSLLYYSIEYLECVTPSVTITFIDNNYSFYKLKTHKKNLITVFVQNGIRGESAFAFETITKQMHIQNRCQVDYMLTFGSAIGQKFSEHITGKIIPIGSIKNNIYQSKMNKELKTVIFISQYKLPPCPAGEPILIRDNRPIYWEQFYSAEKYLLPLLQQYCLENKLELKICMLLENPVSAKEEYNYFRTLLGREISAVLKKKETFTSYEEVDAAEFVVFVNSTLGYEALARGKKTAAFTIRGKSLETASSKFGWPADLPDNGPFWTNHADEQEFRRVMDYITTVSDEEWEETYLRYIPELMEYDPGNTRFLHLMRELGVPLQPEYQKDIQNSTTEALVP